LIEERSLSEAEAALLTALRGIGIEDAGQIAAAKLLQTDLPWSLLAPIEQRAGRLLDEENEPLQDVIDSVREPTTPDERARLLRLYQGRPDPAAKWEDLNPADRKAAKGREDALWRLDLLDTFGRGRRVTIDPALILYDIAVLECACGRRFRFSRSKEGGMAGGPDWRALIAALRLQLPSAINGQEHAHGVERIVRLVRRADFGARLTEKGIALEPQSIAANASLIRLLIASTP
jgi:hypothetical protein